MFKLGLAGDMSSRLMHHTIKIPTPIVKYIVATKFSILTFNKSFFFLVTANIMYYFSTYSAL